MKKSNIFYALGALILIFMLMDCGDKKDKKTNDQTEQEIQVIRDEVIMNTLTENEIQGGWKLLFDGNTTNGWHKFNQDSIDDGWIVEDGCFVALGKGGDIGGDIVTDEEYDNFELKMEWKISAGGNSGILYRVLEGDYPAVYATGPEYQLIDDIGFPQKLKEWQTTGANYAMHPPQNAKIKPVGEWNSSRILINDSHVEHWLNGEKVVEYELWTDEWKEKVKNSKWSEYPKYGLAHSGHISLQDHGSVTWFRNIKIREL